MNFLFLNRAASENRFPISHPEWCYRLRNNCILSIVRYANGAGRFVETGPGGWAEYQNGQLVYFFQEISRVGEEVYLYDSGRDIHVRLVRGEATVTRDGVLLVIIQGSFAG